MEHLETQTNAKPVLSLSLPREERAELEALATAREWSLAQASRYVLRLGLRQLREDKTQKPESETALAA